MSDWIDFFRRSKKPLIVAGVLALLVAPVWLWTLSQNDPPAGDPATHARIKTMTDCAELQEAFDTASDNFDRSQKATPQSAWSLAYMKTAEARLNELGCP